MITSHETPEGLEADSAAHMNFTINRRWLVLFALMLLFIAAVSAGADVGIIPTKLFGITYADKAGHFVLYGTLAFLLHLALNRRAIHIGAIAIPIAFLIACALGLADEGQQYFMPHRAFDLSDFAADVVGIALFIWALEIWDKRTLTESATRLE